MCDNFVEIAKKLGAKHIREEDEGIAYCINSRSDPVKDEAIGRLIEKYYPIVQDYIQYRFPELSAVAKDTTADSTFDRIRKYVETDKLYTDDNGSLGSFVTLSCVWSGKYGIRFEKRRNDLLSRELQDLWCVQRDQADAYRGDHITEQDVEDLMNALRSALGSEQFPNTSLILEAISAVFIRTNGWQVQGLAPNPSISAIQKYLESNGTPLSELEINHCLKVLRNRARTILRENGWEVGAPLPKRV